MNYKNLIFSIILFIVELFIIKLNYINYGEKMICN